ncbi:TPA: hypothetical protein ACS7XC_001495 [Providencia alcalifaciens]|uniref:Uncharacterized protein n=2 Tax=Morganellaceae TaxID=1903414 RepID=D1P380_9GAMM|nr:MULTISPECIES: hypothetical protein [Morganellaceae]EFB71996.1 hypothetical protein PROVRUST_06750 [Providencia rustigianii DSM 4541]EUD08185.1 hypothetical protein HMPREF1564_1196 [Providencia alcalifaciens R90-1475]UNH37810.1 hypothetical protein MNY70_09790 [Moellerella wisconsensis]SUC27728.1 Uncharacterised protein [Providencia rustigianii]
MKKSVYKASGLWDEKSFITLFVASSEKDVLSTIAFWANLNGARVDELSIERYCSVH